MLIRGSICTFNDRGLSEDRCWQYNLTTGSELYYGKESHPSSFLNYEYTARQGYRKGDKQRLGVVSQLPCHSLPFDLLNLDRFFSSVILAWQFRQQHRVRPPTLYWKPVLRPPCLAPQHVHLINAVARLQQESWIQKEIVEPG